jgi:hypothetical protein
MATMLPTERKMLENGFPWMDDLMQVSCTDIQWNEEKGHFQCRSMLHFSLLKNPVSCKSSEN